MPLPQPTLSLKGRALRLLSGREHSRAELQRKLGAHEQEPGQLQRVLDELQANDFINEQRAIDSVVHRRSAKLGAMRIQQELLSKGLDSKRVQAALAGLRASELVRAREVWRRKFDTLPGDAVERGKQARFLAARGFDGDVVRRVLAGSEPD